MNCLSAGTESSCFPTCLLSGSRDGTGRLWDIRSGVAKPVRLFRGFTAKGGAVTACAFSSLPLTWTLPTDATSSSSSAPTTANASYATPSASSVTTDTAASSINERQQQTQPKDGRNPYSVFFAAAKRIFEFDLRANAVLHSQPLHTYKKHEEDVNCIVQSPDGHILVAADDEGCLYVDPVSTREPGRCRMPLILSGAHASICTTLAFTGPLLRRDQFRSRIALHTLVSGGLDCKVCYWDAGLSSTTLLHTHATANVDSLLGLEPRTTASTSVATATTTSTSMSSSSSSHSSPASKEATSAGRLLNPPFLHVLAPSPDGSYLVAGLGNGDLGFLAHNDSSDPATSSNGSFVSRPGATATYPLDLGTIHGHNHAVVVVEFPRFHAAGFGSSDVLVSVGHDKRAIVWSGIEAEVQERTSSAIDQQRRSMSKSQKKRLKQRLAVANARSAFPTDTVNDEETDSAASKEEREEATRADNAPEEDEGKSCIAADAVRQGIAADAVRQGGLSLLDGMYEPLAEWEQTSVCSRLIRARVPLRARANAAVTDTQGWLWVADNEADFYGIHLAR